MSEEKKAKRPNPDRVDFQVLTDRVLVTKYDRAGDRSIPWDAAEFKPWGEAELAEALDWCKNNDYIVREFPGGARAFKGELYAIRTADQMGRMRRRLEAAGKGFFWDLRYDLF